MINFVYKSNFKVRSRKYLLRKSSIWGKNAAGLSLDEKNLTTRSNTDKDVSTRKNDIRLDFKTSRFRTCYGQISSEIQIRVGPDNVQKYLDILKALYSLLCIVVMLLMCNMICGSSRAVTTKGLKCNVCGNGKDVYHFSPEFDAVYGDTCAIAAPDVEHTYTY